MAFRAKFNFRDSRGRSTSRTVHNTEALIASVITEVGVLAPLWNAITDLQLVNVVLTQVTTTGAFAGAAVSNVDENTSVKVEGSDGRIYDFDLPDLPDALHPIEALDITDADITAFFDEFDAADTWRVNLSNPTDIVALISGQLDK